MNLSDYGPRPEPTGARDERKLPAWLSPSDHGMSLAKCSWVDGVGHLKLKCTKSFDLWQRADQTDSNMMQNLCVYFMWDVFIIDCYVCFDWYPFVSMLTGYSCFTMYVWIEIPLLPCWRDALYYHTWNYFMLIGVFLWMRVLVVEHLMEPPLCEGIFLAW